MSHLAELSGPSACRRILIVFNPAAGRARRSRVDRVVATLQGFGCAVTVKETEAPGHAETIARDVADDDFDVIAAAGGDGTINEIVNGLKGNNLALGVIPLGTANVVADEIGLCRSPAAVANALAHGPAKPIHVGTVNGRRFVMMASAGFDANVVSKISPPLKKNWDRLLTFCKLSGRLSRSHSFGGMW
jgi:diacylglycerol kinase (ATP)